MDERDFNERNDKPDVYSKSVRAGKRTYFFDVRATKDNELYLTITESKRRFNQDTGKYVYEKHKLFLYAEDFAKFQRGLSETIHFIHTGAMPQYATDEYQTDDFDTTDTEEINYNKIDNTGFGDMKSEFTDLDFEDLDEPSGKV